MFLKGGRVMEAEEHDKEETKGKVEEMNQQGKEG